MPFTCLIVDDSPRFLAAVKQLLADDGVTVVGVATTADEAVAASARRPDVVLVEIELAAEGGLDVAPRLARLPDGGPPVVLISAESGSELAELVDVSGALGFVSKSDLSAEAIRTLLAG